VGCCSRKILAFVLKVCKRKQTCIKKIIQKLDKILKEQNQTYFTYFNLNCYSSSLIYSFKNEIQCSCFNNLCKKINKHNTPEVKEKKLPSANTPRSALRERQCLSLLGARVQLPVCAYAQQSNTTPLEL
jgi:hypothetical protein